MCYISCCCRRSGDHNTVQSPECSKWEIIRKISFLAAGMFVVAGAASVYISMIKTPPYHPSRDLALGLVCGIGGMLSTALAYYAARRSPPIASEV